MDYAVYDKNSAYLRRADLDLRARLHAILNDRTNTESAVDSVLDLIDNHQASVIRPTFSNSRNTLPSNPTIEDLPQPPPSTSVHPYQPFQINDMFPGISSVDPLRMAAIDNQSTNASEESVLFPHRSGSSQLGTQISSLLTFNGDFGHNDGAPCVGEETTSDDLEVHQYIDPRLLHKDNVENLQGSSHNTLESE